MCQMHVSASWSFFYASHIQKTRNVPKRPSPPPLMPPCKTFIQFMRAILSYFTLFSSCSYEYVFLNKQSSLLILLVLQLLSVGLLLFFMTKWQIGSEGVCWRILYCKCLGCSLCSFTFFLLFRNMFKAYAFPYYWNIRLSWRRSQDKHSAKFWLTAVTEWASLISLAGFCQG